MYISREIESKISSYLKQFKVVLLTGARQTGKTTLLKHLLSDRYEYATLDDMNNLDLAVSDPKAFLGAGRLPIIVDEVQQAPDLFRQTKLVVDALDEYGAVVLTGSQTYQLMQGVSESLAGRVGILEMSGLSLREILGRSTGERYVPRLLSKKDLKQPEDRDIWSHIQRGSMPELQRSEVDWYDYYSSYVKSYLERDVRQLVNLKNERKFYSFMVAAAARTGQLLNASDIANTVDVDVKTVQGWISVLQASGIIHVMQPFWTNTTKRLAKTPKIFFMDTGLACHLTGWNTPDQLRLGAVSGHMFETFAVSEVLKSYMNAGRDLREVSFYRDSQKREIDLVIQDGRTLHPVEIKAGVQVRKDAVKHFSCLEGMADYEVGFGHVICQTPEPYIVARDVQAIPVWAI
ncbi:DUF4143 domain-containing protein [Eggerthellaceae bacterium zg-887]|uniref:ATP-binding protein n=1 Tax=Xiamenia xianingshaonis TaxID=2682776 RepID=UPI00140B23D2|nr:ATP-binding protein [Xiamenia xianingshaonis]NHM16577.1 DUF4143 domain-containing protein [Xiamenia xianingshaonis]